MSETTQLDERIKNRVKRRWKRRARIVAPFAALPLLLGTLVFSIDFIEYSPQEDERENASNKQVQRAAATRERLSIAARAARATSAVVSPKELFDKTGPAVDGLEGATTPDPASVRAALSSLPPAAEDRSPSTNP